VDSVGTLDGFENGNVTYAAGFVGQAFRFDGNTSADTSVSFAAPGIPRSGDWTIAFFMKSDPGIGFKLAVPVSQGSFEQDGVAFQYGSWFQPVLSITALNNPTNGNTFQFEDYSSSETDWHHIALSHDSSTNTNTMYLDGLRANARIFNQGITTDMPNSEWTSAWLNPSNFPLRFADDNFNPGRNWAGLLDDVRIYDEVLSDSQIASLVVPVQTFEWAVNGSGDWNLDENWNPLEGAPPNEASQRAVFGQAITSPRTVFTDTPVTVHSIEFASENTYAIAGTGTLSLEANDGNAGIDVVQGDHQFQSVVNLNSNTDVNIASTGSLAFINFLNLNGNTLIKRGDGTLTIHSTLNSGSGTVVVEAGILSGGGTIAGDVRNEGGMISPGNSVGVFTVVGDYTHGDEATLLAELAGLAAGDEYDVLVVDRSLSLVGSLEVALLDGFTPANGQSFQVLSFSSLTGEFGSIRLPDLSGSLRWDTSGLYTSGRLSVVPEPSAVTLVLLVLVVLASVSSGATKIEGYAPPI